MLLSNKLASAGLLLVVALTIAAVHVQGNGGRELKAVKRHAEHEGGGKIIDKRQADEEPKPKPAKKGKKTATATTTTTAAPGGSTTTAKAGGKKHKTTTTTTAPGGSTTTTKKAGGSTTTTKKAGGSTTTSTTKKPGGKDGDKNGTTTTQSPHSKRLEELLKELGKIRKEKKLPKNDSRMKEANDKWLDNQESLAVEHMLAGVTDLHKVVTQTNGKIRNKEKAGEVFDKLNKLTRLMRNENSPQRLIAVYQRSKLSVTKRPSLLTDD